MMEVLFKEYNGWFYHIKGNDLTIDSIHYHMNTDLSNVTHLDDVEVLYHYRDSDGCRYSVYYEYNNRFITKSFMNNYYYIDSNENYIKDYTLVNLNIL